MVKSGLEVILEKFPDDLKGKRVGILCHASSVTKYYNHITDVFHELPDCKLSAIFGPQHGLFGQTQDNMIEWSDNLHPVFKIPVFSLYGNNRKPTAHSLSHIDILLIDLQDVGARLYTYAWTVKLCLEACEEAGIPVWLLDRPNPIAGMGYDGPVLKREYFTFVGGASIPMCHRMTIGEISLWLKDKYFKKCELNVVRMKGWNRSMMFNETGLPWIIPSPNMPTLKTAIVYPGTVLFEALNISEARGTTIPFELFGAPFINPYLLKKNLEKRNIEGCCLRVHNFIPTFNKYKDLLCGGLHIHVDDPRKFKPVSATYEIIEAIIATSGSDQLKFKDPPYEYEYKLMPFDILSGDDGMRKAIQNIVSFRIEEDRWKVETEVFKNEFREYSLYPEE